MASRISAMITRNARSLSRLPLANSAIGILANRLLPQSQILFFHGVEEKLLDLRLQAMQIELAEFEALMLHLKRHYQMISIAEYAERQQSSKPDLSRCILITFDDGYRSNHRLVAPLLQSLDIPFTIYLTTHSIETGERLPTFIARAALHLTEQRRFVIPETSTELPLENDLQRRAAVATINQLLKMAPVNQVHRLIEALRGLLTADRWLEVEATYHSDAFMNWQEVRELHLAGVTIGAHGHEHVPLHERLESGEVERQIHQSRDAILQQIGCCEHYAFPNGTPKDISAEAVDCVKRAGFRTAVSTFSTSLQASISPFLLPRICVYRIGQFHRTVLKNRFNGSHKALREWQSSLQASALR